MGNNTQYQSSSELYRSSLAADSRRDCECDGCLTRDFQKGWGFELRDVEARAKEAD